MSRTPPAGNGEQPDGLAVGEERLAAARALLRLGWAVLPCCPPDHVGVGKKHAATCDSRGKVPLISWKQYQTELPTAADLERWLRDWENANLWCALGPVSGVVRIDQEG